LTKNSSCATGDVRERRFGLRAGRVHHQHGDRPEPPVDRRDEALDGRFVGHIGAERVGNAAFVPDRVGHRARPTRRARR
jgi:hypothetical protein